MSPGKPSPASLPPTSAWTKFISMCTNVYIVESRRWNVCKNFSPLDYELWMGKNLCFIHSCISLFDTVSDIYVFFIYICISLYATYESSKKKLLLSILLYHYILQLKKIHSYVCWINVIYVSAADRQTHLSQRHTCYRYGYYFIWQQSYPCYWKGSHFQSNIMNT